MQPTPKISDKGFVVVAIVNFIAIVGNHLEQFISLKQLCLLERMNKLISMIDEEGLSCDDFYRLLKYRMNEIN